MNNLKKIILVLLIANSISCSKKIVSPEELKNIAKTDSIKKENLKSMAIDIRELNEENNQREREETQDR